VPFRGGSWVPVLGRGLLPYKVASASIQPLGHNRHGPKFPENWGRCAPFKAGGAATPSKTLSPEVYLGTKWHLDPSSGLATTAMSHKLGGAVSFFLGGAGYPSNTKSTGQRPTSIPSGILVHPYVWPQRTLARN